MMNKAEKYFDEKGVDIGQIVCYYVRGGMGDGIDFDPVEFATDFAEKEYQRGYEEGKAYYEVPQVGVNKCDVCGNHPSVLITTNFGIFCQEHARYV